MVAGVISTILFSVIAGVFYFMGETSDRSNKGRTKELMETIKKNEKNLADTIMLQ